MEHILWTAIAAFLIAMLSGMGVGSAGLLVVYLSAVEHMPQMEAQGLNLIFFLIASLAAMCVHVRQRTPAWEAVLLLSLSGVAGAVIGSSTAAMLPETLMRRLFGAMMIAAGALSLLRSGGKHRKKGVKSP